MNMRQASGCRFLLGFIPVNCAIFAYVFYRIISKLHIRRKEKVNKHD